MTRFAGIEIPSNDPLFLSIVGIHVALALTCVVAGAVAMLSMKTVGRHPHAGRIYTWALMGVFVTTAALSAMRWPENKHLLALGAGALVSALVGRQAKRRNWSRAITTHILGMGVSYILLLTAFYVDNGHQLPGWRDLPSWAYWIIPSLVGWPLIGWAALRHPLAGRAKY